MPTPPAAQHREAYHQGSYNPNFQHTTPPQSYQQKQQPQHPQHEPRAETQPNLSKPKKNKGTGGDLSTKTVLLVVEGSEEEEVVDQDTLGGVKKLVNRWCGELSERLYQ